MALFTNKDICPTCTEGRLDLILKANLDILNLYYLRYKNLKCRRSILLRSYSFLKDIRNWPYRVAFTILELFVNEGIIAKKLKSIIQNKSTKELNSKFIQNILIFSEK